MKKTILLLALLALAAACRRHSVTVDSNGSTVAVDEKNGQVTVKTDQGTAVYSANTGSSLPAGFPKDVPVYPGATLTASATASLPAGASDQVLTFDTRDSTDAVVAFYKSKMAGWQTSAEVGIPDGKMLVLQSPDTRRHLSMMASSKSGKTSVKLSVNGS